MNKFITRIAPSPTGMFHLGTARTAYFNYLAAKASRGTFILRIDDTDVERNKTEYTKIIIDSLDWLGLVPDKIYYQSERIKLYQSEAKGLLQKGKAIELDNGAIALLCPKELPRSFNDTISGQINITDTNREQIHGKLIMLRGAKKSEDGKWDNSSLGLPTYQFASALDDYLLDINWIIRGNDHITNTPKQIAVWQSLNETYGEVQCPKPSPQFTHLGMITITDPETNKPKKLSKRDGAASLLWYKEQGYTSEAMLDWMLRLGWSLSVPRGATEEQIQRANQPITKTQAIELIFNGRMKNSPCAYSIDKLNSLQKEYV